ncbi:b9ec185b-151d-488c-9e76-f9a31870d8f9-CDS [Sclerotinia trifoliorum]|uniref:B9ec185b-151d-488c-9e76-f9a31870d8f9-CDS n=1 Tax=Sclerotinia trifoliorum TaxID=28548 RepID=A0A8H2ZQD1_9HELO|nr:b9ec185b-151d-488c-9e76-f9a31870d8f9-CDS [Sclerotinia trifoliorum]
MPAEPHKYIYDHIQKPYDYIRTASIALIERENIHTTITPHIRGARILDLACGSGFYTSSFVPWGAASVLGVDISPVMIDRARQHSRFEEDSGSISFIHADCSIPRKYEGGPFDIVFAAWLLNYAPDRENLVSMFRNVEMNLKEGGRFIAVTLPPSSNPVESINAEARLRPGSLGGSGYLVYRYVSDLRDGILFHAHGDTPVGDLDFECFYLRREVYEEAAREAGLKGSLEWGVTRVPESYLKGREGGASLRELVSYGQVPGYGVLVIEK